MDFEADKVKLSLSEDLSTYTFHASINPETIIDVPSSSYYAYSRFNSNALVPDSKSATRTRTTAKTQLNPGATCATHSGLAPT
jgi:hypothetical protein